MGQNRKQRTLELKRQTLKETVADYVSEQVRKLEVKKLKKEHEVFMQLLRTGVIRKSQ